MQPRPLRSIAALALFISVAAVATASATPIVVVQDRALARQESHGAGATTVYRYTDAIEPRSMEFRRRTFDVGADMAAHVISRDQVYYVVSGEGDLIANGAPHRLTTGMSAYVPRNTQVAIRQRGGIPFSIVLAWNLAALPPAPSELGPAQPVVLRDREIAREEAPHGGIGMSTGYRYSDHVPNRFMNYRRRTLQVGAQIVEHVIPTDQVYYVLEGHAEIEINRIPHTMEAGVAIYAYGGSTVRIVPTMGRSVSYILAEPLPPSAANQANVTIVEANIGREETPPHNGVGASTSFLYTNLAPGLRMELRKRTLQRGARVGRHVVSQDQIFYVLEGEAEIVADGVAHRLPLGSAAYVYNGTAIEVRQHGRSATSVLVAWPRNE